MLGLHWDQYRYGNSRTERASVCGNASTFATAGRSAREHGIGVGLYVYRATGAVRVGAGSGNCSFVKL